MLRTNFLVLLLFFSKSLFAQLHTVGEHRIENPTPVSATPVKDQYMSGTCWSFASNSFIESELLRMGKKEVDLSEMYTARLSYIQKIITHLRQKGTNYFTPGGQFHDVQWVLKNYGMVPEEAYTGRVRGEIHHRHANLDTSMKQYVAKMVADGKIVPDEKDMAYINNLLDTYLGKLPRQFSYHDKSINPSQYLSSELGFNPDDYIEITSYSHHPWYKSFQLENKYNWSQGQYMNVPLDDFIRITDEALQKGYSLLWNGDAKDDGFLFYDGLAVIKDFKGDLALERQRTFADSSSYMDHMMHVIAVTRDDKGQSWYYIKNSWGNTSNSEGGYLYMNKSYFILKTAAIVVNKQAIPGDIRKKMGL